MQKPPITNGSLDCIKQYQSPAPSFPNQIKPNLSITLVMMLPIPPTLLLLSFFLLQLVDALTNVGTVAVSQSSVCALVTNGITGPGGSMRNGVKCWGSNAEWSLGTDGIREFETDYSNIFLGVSQDSMGIFLPFVDIGTDESVAFLTAGANFNCVVLENLQVKCWGDNESGQLGQGFYNYSGNVALNGELPDTLLGSEAEIANITCGWLHTCALFSNGLVKCWGGNYAGQLGLGLGAPPNYTVGDIPSEMGNDLPYLDFGTIGKAQEVTIKQIAAGYLHTCALTTQSSGLKCWGFNSLAENYYGLGGPATGQLGSGTMVLVIGSSPSDMGSNLPDVNLGSNTLVLNFALGDAHTCAIVSGNDVKCWGDNTYGQLGLPGISNVGISATQMGNSLPAIDVGAKVLAISLGSSHTCVLTTTYQVKCWGGNGSGQLGIGSTVNQIPATSSTSQRINVTSLMGTNLSFVNVGTGYTVLSISAGGSTTCAVLSNEKVKCWGDNTFGRAGICSEKTGIGFYPYQMGDYLPFVDDCGFENGTIIITTEELYGLAIGLPIVAFLFLIGCIVLGVREWKRRHSHLVSKMTARNASDNSAANASFRVLANATTQPVSNTPVLTEQLSIDHSSSAVIAVTTTAMATTTATAAETTTTTTTMAAESVEVLPVVVSVTENRVENNQQVTNMEQTQRPSERPLSLQPQPQPQPVPQVQQMQSLPAPQIQQTQSLDPVFLVWRSRMKQLEQFYLMNDQLLAGKKESQLRELVLGMLESYTFAEIIQALQARYPNTPLPKKWLSDIENGRNAEMIPETILEALRSEP